MPGDSAPANGLLPATSTLPDRMCMVKSLAVAVPPLSLITCLITVSVGATSSLVIVHVFVSPTASVTVPAVVQSPLIEAA